MFQENTLDISPLAARTVAAIGVVALWSALPSSYALEPDQVFAKVSPSIVTVTARRSSSPESGWFGSGVVIAPGQVVTNCHIIEGADVVLLKRGEYSTIGFVRYTDPGRDLCQLGATDPAGFEKAVTRLDVVSSLRVGEKVYAIGAPQGLELTLSDGLIASLRKLPSGETIIQTSAPISKGSSGGGLFDSNGRLIGITSYFARMGQNLNFAIPASWISELPERHKARELAKANKAIEETRGEHARTTEDDLKREEERKQHEANPTKRSVQVDLRAVRQMTVADWSYRIQAKIKSRLVVPPGVDDNAETRFDVVVMPGGEILSATLKKTSGNPGYDAAVERAISAAQPLPVPSDTDLFQEHFRELTLVFRPRDLRNGPAANSDFTAEEQYRQLVAAHIGKYHEYPEAARRERLEGTTLVEIKLTTEGSVIGTSVVATSRFQVLDEAALRMTLKSAPLPSPPAALKIRDYTIRVPITFNLARELPSATLEQPANKSPIAPITSDTTSPHTTFRTRDFSKTPP